MSREVNSMNIRRALTLQRGFSLVELMVAMVLGLIILGALILTFTANKRSYESQNTFARIQENGRYAMDLIIKDLRLAGYWGGV